MQNLGRCVFSHQPNRQQVTVCSKLNAPAGLLRTSEIEQYLIKSSIDWASHSAARRSVLRWLSIGLISAAEGNTALMVRIVLVGQSQNLHSYFTSDFNFSWVQWIILFSCFVIHVSGCFSILIHMDVCLHLPWCNILVSVPVISTDFCLSPLRCDSFML